MKKPLAHAFIAGLLASGLFLFVFGLGLGFIFMFLPTLPLLALGLSKAPRLALYGAFFATALITMLTDMAVGLLFLLFLGLPAWFLARESLRARSHGPVEEWLPIGLILTQLTLYACAFVALLTLFYALQPESLPQVLSQNIQAAFADLKGSYGQIIDTLANEWSFLVFSIAIWLWGMTLYFHGWLAHRALAKKGIVRRPDFRLRPFMIPSWMLSLLAICALASLAGGESLRFLGKSTLISLMLPYFFAGAALMHETSKNWPSRGFFLFFIYFIIFAQFWPALFLSGVGLWVQIKGLSGEQTSSKN